MDDLENSDDIEEVTDLRAMINDAAAGGITDTPEQISTPSDDEDVESKVANVDEAVGEVEEAQEVEPIQPIEPPTSWRADKKEAFKKLPPDIQEYVVQRESERDAYLNQKGQKYSELDKVLAEREEEWSRHGQSSAKVVSQLLAWDKYLQDRPIDAIQELAAKAGIDLAQFARVQQAQGPQDPYVRHALTELERLKSEQAQERERIAYEREQQTYQGLNSEIERFRSSTKDGQPAFPHFDSVREDMAHMLPLIQNANPNASTQEVLEEAYSRAVRANPTTFEAYQKDLEAQRELKNRQRVQQKKIAASSISGSPQGARTDLPTMSLRETIEAARDGRLPVAA